MGDTSDVRSPTSTSTEVRSPTSTSTEVRSPTSTSTEVRSPTSTSTDAYTQGNVTVTGGAGAGSTSVNIYRLPPGMVPRADQAQYMVRSVGVANRMQRMIDATSAPRVPGVMPNLMEETGAPRPQAPMYDIRGEPSHGKLIAVGGIAVAALAAGLYATFKRRH